MKPCAFSLLNIFTLSKSKMQENPNLISIIIPCFNDDEYIEKAVQSALDQTYKNKEIIVVDDGSNAKTKAVLKRLEPKIDLLITQDNQGQSIARNNAIKKATGAYILNLDSDDHFEKSFCGKAVKKFLEDSEIKIITCHAQRFDKKGEIDVFVPRGGNLENFLFVNAALGSVMFKKSDWEKTGGYEEELPILGFEDWEFYIQLLKSGGYAYIIPELLFNYQIRENSTTNRIKDLKFDKLKNIIFKHRDLYKENFDLLILDLIERLKSEEKEKIKNRERMEFNLGNTLLKFPRFIKSLPDRILVKLNSQFR